MTTTDEGLSFQFMAGLTASIEGLAAQMENDRAERQCIAQAIHPFKVPGIPVPSSGTLDQPNLLGPRTGQYWDIHRISCTGFSAGSVTAYLNSAFGDEVETFAAAGIIKYGKAQQMLTAGDRLVFVATGITGSVVVSFGGTEIAAPYIGYYLS